MNTPTVPERERQRLHAHFGLAKLPFRKNMYAADMFDSRSQRDLGHGLRYWSEVKGVALVTGASGVGKSITLRRFAQGLDDARYRVVQLPSVPTTTTGFLRSLNRALGLPMRAHASDLFDQAHKHLCAHVEDQAAHPLLILDDVEGMSPELLDIVRRLTAYALDAEDRFSVLITATDEILRTLRHPMLDPLRTRIGFAASLRPFSLEDTRNYVAFHLKKADADPKLFSDDAVRRLFQASQGRPRQINQLALHVLIQAAVVGVETVAGDFFATQLSAHPLFDAAIGAGA